MKLPFEQPAAAGQQTSASSVEPTEPRRRVYKVSELSREIRNLLERAFGEIWVEGEISNFRPQNSGHYYFTLKDQDAQLRCVCFRSQNRFLKFIPQDGMSVLARGRVSVYEPRGEYQMVVESLEPLGVGSLQLAFEQLKEKLQKEGLFDPAHKKKLPLLPRKVGIVTSPTGAAIRDMLRVLQRRNRNVHVLIFPVKVQGEGAATEIAAAIRYLNRMSGLDVLIVGRGGGSMEDLWAFNEEMVARAIYHSRIPVISAVGHEIDFTIADFVADLRAATPSAAAELVAGARDELLRNAENLATRLERGWLHGLQTRRGRLELMREHRAFDGVRGRLRSSMQRLDECNYRMEGRVTQRLEAGRSSFEMLAQRLERLDLRSWIVHRREFLRSQDRHLKSGVTAVLDGDRKRFEIGAHKLEALSPLAVLDRGYAICRKTDGTIVKRAADARVGEEVDIALSRGHLTGEIKRILES